MAPPSSCAAPVPPRNCPIGQGGNLSWLQPLDMDEAFGGWRSCRDDGNTFYRCAGFAMVEATLQDNPKKISELVHTIQSVHSNRCQTQRLEELLVSFLEKDRMEALCEWYHALLFDPFLDKELVTMIRQVSADFLARNPTAHLNDVPLGVIAQRLSNTPLEDFIQNMILQDGVEASHFTLALAPMAFQLELEIIEVGPAGLRERFEVKYNWCNTQYVSSPGVALSPRQLRRARRRPVATLLARSGSFAVYYSHGVAKQISVIQEQLGIQDRKSVSTTPGMEDDESMPSTPRSDWLEVDPDLAKDATCDMAVGGGLPRSGQLIPQAPAPPRPPPPFLFIN